MDKNYKGVIAHALTLSKLMEKIGNTDRKGVIAKANKITHAYLG